MSTERELLAECLRALNAARRFNYGVRGARDWCTGKRDSYDLAARLEKHLYYTTRQAENQTDCQTVEPGPLASLPATSV